MVGANFTSLSCITFSSHPERCSSINTNDHSPYLVHLTLLINCKTFQNVLIILQRFSSSRCTCWHRTVSLPMSDTVSVRHDKAFFVSFIPRPLYPSSFPILVYVFHLPAYLHNSAIPSKKLKTYFVIQVTPLGSHFRSPEGPLWG